jgi:hypothetical protein
MSASYPFVPIPLDTSADNATSFALHLLSTIEFSAGSTSGDAIAAAVRAHPLLSRDAATPLRALAMPYAGWTTVRKITAGAPGVVEVTLAYAGRTPFGKLRTTLADYLSRSTPVATAQLRPDTAHDKRVAADFLDITGAHNRLARLRGLIGQGFATSAGLRAATFDDLSDRSINYAQRRWLDGTAQGVVIALLFGSLKADTLGLGREGAELVAQLKADVAVQRRRLNASVATPLRSDAALVSTAADGDSEVDPRDPNAAIHAALSNGLIAEATGMATRWTATTAQPLSGDYVIAIDPASFAAEAAVNCSATAFRRTASTHPLSFADIGKPTRTNGLAALNDENGLPRYSATGINAEVALIQGTILQADNSVADAPSDAPALLDDGTGRRDDRAPVELAGRQVGYNELEAAGLTVSAPPDDLVTPDLLKSQTRAADFPCLFLEDLWTGFRMDIAAEGQGALRSIHRHHQRISFAASGRTIRGDGEDFWPREAANVTSDQLSTEIIRYNGLSSAQTRDYAIFLGTDGLATNVQGALFSVEIEGATGVTPLRFGDTYAYRLRNVFQGGISLADDDPGLDALGGRHIQTAPFLRARSYRAGEIIAPADKVSTGDGRLTVFLSETERSARLLIAPAPVDTDTARYNGQFLGRADEATRDAGRAFVTDLAEYLRTGGSDAAYYCDPDVAAISVELWLRNGDPQSTERNFSFEDGTYCEMIDPLHVGPVTARFGAAGRWRDFRPIEIILSRSTDLRPALRLEAGGRRVRVTLPPAAEIELVLTPAVTARAVQATARFAPSNSLLALAGGALPASGAGLPLVEHRIRAIHCTRTPMATPRLVSESNAPGGTPLAIFKRPPASDRAELAGYVDVDAASSGEVRIAGAWKEIDDDPTHERYVLKDGRTVSRPRSVQFRDYGPPGPGVALQRMLAQGLAAQSLAGVSGMIGQQCAENRIFMGGSKPATPTGTPDDSETPPCVLALGNGRRARLTLSATATARHAARYPVDPRKPTSLTSLPIIGEVPAAVELSEPAISHVMPLVRQQTSRDKGRQIRVRLYAFRIYVRRPWFQSGPGERLAIGCHVGTVAPGPRDTVPKSYSQWGEDPIARTHVEVSKRLPRASDFRTATTEPLDPDLYAADAPEGVGALLYFDDVVRDSGAAGTAAADAAHLSLASYALCWDDTQKLWYCDIELGNDFTGWLGLALYRHQPHAHEGLQISQSAAWLCSQQLQGERVTWFRQAGILHVTIGPVYDRTLGFEAEQRRYENGISLTDTAPERLSFRSFEVDGRVYFEGRFEVTGSIEIVRRRFDFDIASFTLEAI